MNIKTFITRYVDPDFKGDELPFPIQTFEFAKEDIITDFGEVETHAYFLTEGITQISLEKNGTERVLDFFFPGSFFSSYTSLLKQEASDVQVMALTNCKVEAIKGVDLANAYQHSLLANKVGRIATEYNYMRRVGREKDLLSKTADERYQDIFKKHPEIINQLPVYKIASYLGIHPESLSRIRKKVIS
ncbi:MAG: cyclic nucleotide-binding domain-containing protein [Bacteroidia bacterium]|nr:cyclic nucleotide-binding domain-containing protein [Bacteroidia bacterium]